MSEALSAPGRDGIGSRLLDRVAAKIDAAKVPVGVKLWTGQTIAGSLTPRVWLQLNSRAALSLFVRPDLSRLAERYVRGDIDVQGEIKEVFRIIGRLFDRTPTDRAWLSRFNPLRHTRRRDQRAIQHHYDVSNEFYALWLDAGRVYSCAYFRTPDDSLDLAQQQKLDLICRKLNLQPGERLLDIGCGWGGLIYHAAQRYGVSCEGITLSQAQHDYVREQIAARSLAGQVEVRIQDYRDVPEDRPFDKVVSVGMFEHVGVRLLPAYFAKMFRLVKPGGVVMNHGITSRTWHGESVSTGNRFIEKYIFPEGELTHLAYVIETMAKAGFEVTDCENLRRHYAQTLWHWASRLEAHREAAAHLVGEERYRAWRAYLGGFAVAFEQGWNNIYQIVAARPCADGSIDHPMTRENVYASAN